MSPISTHVLDTSTGRPAAGMPVLLSARVHGGEWGDLALGFTDEDGRVGDFLPDGAPIAAGTYRLHFDTYDYFLAQGVRAFYPSVVVSFVVDDPSAHFHVPLLLSPFGYSTYRGS